MSFLQGVSVTLHADGSDPPSLHITPQLRVCEETPLLPLYGASFWSSIQTPVSHDTSPKSSCLSLMCPQGVSVQDRDVEGWLVSCFWSQQVTQAMLLMGLCGFILDVPHGLAALRQMLQVLTSPCRSPCRWPGIPRLLKDLAAKSQVSATGMAPGSFGGGLPILSMQGNR